MAFHSWTGLTDPEPFVLQISSYFPIYLPLISAIQYCTDNASITRPFPIVLAFEDLVDFISNRILVETSCLRFVPYSIILYLKAAMVLKQTDKH